MIDSEIIKGADFSKGEAFIWRGSYLHLVREFNAFDIDNLSGIDSQKELLLKNTAAFLESRGGLNVLMYGPRGCGKSTLARAVFTKYLSQLKIVQIGIDDIKILPVLIDTMRICPYKFIIFCDDFSFERDDATYKSLKVILDGSIEKIPDNVLLYVTSNRKHLLPEYDSDNMGAEVINGEIHFGDSVEEKISLSDRFGLVIAFYQLSANDYISVVESYFKQNSSLDSKTLCENLRQEALNYATQRGSRGGRIAFDFYRSKILGLI